MVTGKILSSKMVEKSILEGEFATNFAEAIRKFGTAFVAVHPLPSDCLQALQENADPTERWEENTCYVKMP